MKCDVGDVGEDYVCFYLDGEDDTEKAFLESLVHSRLTKASIFRNGGDTWTLAFTPPPQKRRRIVKQKTTRKGSNQKAD